MNAQTSDITIRLATLNDFPYIQSLLQDSFPNQLRGWYPTHQLSKLLPFLTKPSARLLSSGTFYVAQCGADIIGCGGWTLSAPPLVQQSQGPHHSHHRAKHHVVSEGHNVGQLRLFATATSWTRRSIGRSIFARCLTDCREAGVYKLTVEAVLNAVGFYERLGFVKMETVQRPIGNMSIEVVLMVREALRGV